jgi:ribosomal protein S27E
MILTALHCNVCGHDFAVPVGDIPDPRNVHCVACGKLLEAPQDLAASIQAATTPVLAQRDEIVRAFCAKYHCDPSECVQLTQVEGARLRWWVERRAPVVVEAVVSVHCIVPGVDRQLEKLAMGGVAHPGKD